MTWRAIVLGFLLAAAIAGLSYVNAAVVNQTPLTGNHLPVGVFGVIVLLLLLANPLLRLLKKSAMLRPSEIAVIAALGLAACGWPNSGFFRVFATVLATPAHWVQTNASWRSARVMSYLPNASMKIAEGHVHDWAGLAAKLGDPGGDQPVRQAIWRSFSPGLQRRVAAAARQGTVEVNVRDRLLNGFDGIIDNESFYEQFDESLLPAKADEIRLEQERLRAARADHLDRLERHLALAEETPNEAAADEHENVAARAKSMATYRQMQIARLDRAINRALLVHALAGHIAPPPEGGPILPAEAMADPFAVGTLMQGWDGPENLDVSQLPWPQWTRTVLLWAALALSMGLASLCLVLVVHPQWAKRELLTYPIARFVGELSQPAEGGRLPAVTRSRLFWWAFGGVGVIHLVNGLHTWWSDFFIHVPLKFNFFPLMELMPSASRAPGGAWQMWGPTLYFTVIGFAYFLPTKVSASLGLAGFFWVALSGLLLGNGIQMDFDGMILPINFGAYLGLGLMVLYIGRRYYAQVARSTIGLPRPDEVPAYAVWAARALMVFCVIFVIALHETGVDWVLAVPFLVLCLIMFLMMTRISVETGVFFMAPGWTAVQILNVLYGIEAVGPTAFLILAIVGSLVANGSPETLMPYLANGMEMIRRQNVRPGRAAWPVAGVIVGAFLIALVVTLSLQYNRGVNSHDPWSIESAPKLSFNMTVAQISELASQGELAKATAVEEFDRFAQIKPYGRALRWMAVGLALVIGCAVARLRWAWWPLHPVLFLVWGSWPIYVFGPSFLLGWAVKLGIVKSGGARVFENVKPLMVGLIAAELSLGIFWIIAGAIYYAVTGVSPPKYNVFF